MSLEHMPLRPMSLNIIISLRLLSFQIDVNVIRVYVTWAYFSFSFMSFKTCSLSPGLASLGLGVSLCLNHLP